MRINILHGLALPLHKPFFVTRETVITIFFQRKKTNSLCDIINTRGNGAKIKRPFGVPKLRERVFRLGAEAPLAERRSSCFSTFAA